MSQKTSTFDLETSQDYKQFIHSFESFRQAHPELSFQQVMALFLKNQNAKKSNPA